MTDDPMPVPAVPTPPAALAPGELFRDLLQYATDMIVSEDASGGILYANEAAERGLGWPARELIGRHAIDFVAPEYRGAFLAARERLIAQGVVLDFEAELLTRDGGRFLARGNGNCRRDAQGNLLWTRLIFRDVSAQWRAEQEVMLLERVTRDVAVAADLNDAFRVALQQMCPFGRWDYGEVWLPAADGVFERVVTFCPRPEVAAFAQATEGMRFPPGVGAVGMAAQRRQAVWIESLAAHPELPRARAACSAGLAAALCIPILAADEVLGVFSFAATEPRTADEHGIAALDAVASQIAPVVQRRRAEALVLETQARLTDFLESINDLVMSVTPDQRISFVNRAWLRTLGYRREDLPGLSLETVLHPSCRERCLETFARVLAGESVTDFEAQFVARDGHVVTLEGSSNARFENGRAIATRSIFRDVTARHAAEEERRRLGQMVDLAGDAIVIHNLEDGVITYWNRGAERLYGWTRAEAMGRRIVELLHTTFPAPLEQIRSGIVRAGAWQGELQHTRKDGGVAAVESSWTLLRQEDGSGAVLEINSDVTEKKRFQRALEAAKEAAETATRAKSEFLANMSHEIRTPMNGVIGMTELLLDTDVSPEQREYLELVRGSAEALLRIINDILDFSRIEAGKLVLDPHPFRLRRAFGDVLRTLAVRAREQGITLEDRTAPDVPDALVGDAGRLQQVLVNLVSNAIKFTDRGGVVVDTSAQAEGATVRLHVAVRDTGIGIPPERRGAIFEAFTQADASTTRRYGGTGLGLSISSQLVQLMGGRIWVESEPDQGSAFHFVVQLERAPEATPIPATPKAAGSPGAAPVEPGPAPGRRAPTRAQASAGGLRILVAEDNPVNQRLARAILERAGHTVALAGTGTEALALLARERFDAVLMDVQMPELGGLEATEIIRARERTTGAHLPIVAVTAHALPGDRERCLAAGMDGYVSKPLRAADLAEALRQVTPQPVGTGSAAGGSALSAGAASAAAPEASADGPGDLRARMLAQMDGDARLLGELAELFVTDAGPIRAELQASLAAGEAERVYRAAHRLKGAAGGLGVEDVADAALQLELLARACELTGAPAALAALEARLDPLLVVLRALADAAPAGG